jgi:hypothetical protein
MNRIELVAYASVDAKTRYQIAWDPVTRSQFQILMAAGARTAEDRFAALPPMIGGTASRVDRSWVRLCAG